MKLSLKENIKNMSRLPEFEITFSEEIDAGISENIETLNDILTSYKEEDNRIASKYKNLNLAIVDTHDVSPVLKLQELVNDYYSRFNENRENTEQFIDNQEEPEKIKQVINEIAEFLSELVDYAGNIETDCTKDFSYVFSNFGKKLLEHCDNNKNNIQHDVIKETIDWSTEYYNQLEYLDGNTTELEEAKICKFTERIENGYNNYIELKAKFKVFADFLNKLLDLRTGLLNQYKEKQTKATAALRGDQSQRYGTKISSVKSEMEYLTRVLRMTGYDRVESVYNPSNDDRFDSVSMVSSIGDLSENVPKSSNGTTFELLGDL